MLDTALSRAWRFAPWDSDTQDRRLLTCIRTRRYRRPEGTDQWNITASYITFRWYQYMIFAALLFSCCFVATDSVTETSRLALHWLAPACHFVHDAPQQNSEQFLSASLYCRCEIVKFYAWKIIKSQCLSPPEKSVWIGLNYLGINFELRIKAHRKKLNRKKWIIITRSPLILMTLCSPDRVNVEIIPSTYVMRFEFAVSVI